MVLQLKASVEFEQRCHSCEILVRTKGGSSILTRLGAQKCIVGALSSPEVAGAALAELHTVLSQHINSYCATHLVLDCAACAAHYAK